MAREFDLVLFGATGFVGKLTAQYLAKTAPSTARIALAGRSIDKLAAVQAELGPKASQWGLLVADATITADVAALVRRTSVIVTTVGPYARYGRALVAACAVSGTHYADLTGETLFVRDAIDNFHELAVESGAKLVNSCGFDSIPSDLALYEIYRRTLSDNSGEIENATLVATFKGGASGGTIDSGRAQMEAIARNPKLARVVLNPYSLTPNADLEPKLGRQSDTALSPASDIDKSLTGWVTTFVMAPYNTRVVRRTNALLGYAYGKQLHYREVMSIGDSPIAPVLATAVNVGLTSAFTIGTLLSRGPGKKILDLLLPKPGTGPDEEARAKGFFRMRTYATTSSGAKYVATVYCQADPGYSGTAILLGEAALALAFDGDRLPKVAGVLTPVAALAPTLSTRLRRAGLTIDVQQG